MVVYKNPAAMQRGMAKKVKELKKNKIRTPSRTATYLEAMAIKLAPRGSGETIQGIKKTKKGKGYQVESKVRPKGSKGFRQNLWANQTAPHRTIKPRWAKGKKVVYGDGSHRISGLPRFFHFAVLRTRIKGLEIARENTKNALRAGV